MSRRPRPNALISYEPECPLCRKTQGLVGMSTHVLSSHPEYKPGLSDDARWIEFQLEHYDLWEHAKTKGPGSRFPPIARDEYRRRTAAGASSDAAEAEVRRLLRTGGLRGILPKATPEATAMVHVPAAAALPSITLAETIEVPCPACSGTGRIVYHR